MIPCPVCDQKFVRCIVDADLIRLVPCGHEVARSVLDALKERDPS